jgi:hypothetical protein
LTTLFMTLTGLLAFIPTILAGRPAITSATAVNARRRPGVLDRHYQSSARRRADGLPSGS